MDNEKIIRSYDPQLARRLLVYVKPYRLWFLLALVALVLAAVGELLTPVVMKKVMDEHILVSYIRIREDGAGRTDLKPLWKKQAGEPGKIGGYYYLYESSLGLISGRLRDELEAQGILDNRGWYWVSLEAPEVAEVAARHPDLFVGNASQGALLKTDMASLSREERGIIRAEDMQGLRHYSLIFAGLLLGVLVFSFLQVFLMAFIAQGVMRDMRMGLLSHTLGLSTSFLNKRPVGSLVSRLTSDVETVNELFTSVATSLFRDFFMMVGVVVVLFSLNPRLGLITCLSLPPVLLLSWFFRSRARNAYRRVRLWVSEVNGFLSERISGMEVVQLFGRERRSAGEFHKKNRSLLKADLAEMYIFATFRPLIDLFSSISIGVIIYFGARLFTDNALSLGILIAFVNLIEKFYHPVKDMAEKFNILQSAMAGSERVFDLLDTGTPEEAGTEENLAGKGAKEGGSSPGELVFRNVNFHYNPEEPVLRNLSFTLKPGENLAVVGYTGAGKTTITHLMARFWEIQGGEILLGGRNLKTFPLRELRHRVQSVQQEVFLFSGTLEENISLGKDLSPGELRRAIEIVRADRFIDALPEGLAAPVKEGGVNFSAGQRQLISFARIIAHDPEVIILDEATANIDTETEKLIQQAMAELLKNRTSLVIAHRLSTIRHADRILVINEGSLVEEGSHEELMARQGAYYNLYRLQYERIESG